MSKQRTKKLHLKDHFGRNFNFDKGESALENKSAPFGGAYRHERIEMEDGRICIKYPIHITKDRLMLIERICDTMDTNLDIYLKQALYEKIDSDLHSPQVVGQAFCNSTLEQWNKNNDTNDYRVFQYSTLV